MIDFLQVGAERLGSTFCATPARLGVREFNCVLNGKDSQRFR